MNVLTKQPRYLFNWQNNNRFQLFSDNNLFLKEIIDAIEHAQKSILLEMYLISSGKLTTTFLDAMARAAKRGVKIYLLLDGFGARDLSIADREFILLNNIQLVFYNPNNHSDRKIFLFRDHRKLFLIDTKVAYIGGIGLTDSFLNQQQSGWRDNVIKIEGNNVAQWQQLFFQNWNRWSSTIIVQENVTSSIGNQKGRISITAGPGKMEIKRHFIQRARSASKRLWLCTPYFAPTRKLLRTLKLSAEAGIDVRILCAGPMIDHPMVRYLAQSHYQKLLKAGVKIFEYHSRFLHSKVVLCDNWVSIGSCNLDRWNFLWNLDANQEVEDIKFAEEIESMLKTDYSLSQEILLKQWQQRSLINKFKTWFFAHFFRILDISLSRLRILKYWKSILRQQKNRQ